MISLRQTLRWLSFLAVFFVTAGSGLAADECTAVYGTGALRFSLATGSPGELGLVEALAKEFNRQNGTSLCWVKAGSGESLDLLKDKKVDMILVHAPAAEKKAVADGWAIDRTLIGSNEFFIVGPAADPAGIAKAGSAAEAYQKIASSKANFFSRGDNSGTHKKELAVWQKAGITPAGEWYIVTNDFMMATLKRADAEKGYFMTDSSTWVAANKELPNLKVLFRGDPMLINTYHGLAQPAGATPGQPAAVKFIAFVASKEGQEIIRAFGRDLHGDSLYNDAKYASQFDH
ncbi:MAG: substrate-binding domain-containing protein [Desulfobacterales bacterium]